MENLEPPIRRKSVALIFETSVIYGREILEGISQYIRTHDRWSVFLDERELNAPAPDWLLDWKGDGVICRPTTAALAANLLQRRIPTIDLNDREGDFGLPRISSNMEEIGQMAAKHLLVRGFNNIAYCGFEGERWCDERLEGVRQTVKPCGVLKTSWIGLREHSWEEERNRISDWLSKLPLPLGVVSCNDVRAHHVLDACQSLNLAVPEQVAVVGVDNAATFCSLCNPPLSSVVPNARELGHQAAEMLDQLMLGVQTIRRTVLVPPLGVVTRQSTDSVAVEDEVVASSLQYIRENSVRPVGVEELVTRARVSRSTLERKFKQSLDLTPAEAIVQARLKRVKWLLLNTDWTLAKIADSSGYEHPEYMIVQFQREIGKSPSNWRLTEKLSLTN